MTDSGNSGVTVPNSGNSGVTVPNRGTRRWYTGMVQYPYVPVPITPGTHPHRTTTPYNTRYTLHVVVTVTHCPYNVKIPEMCDKRVL